MDEQTPFSTDGLEVELYRRPNGNHSTIYMTKVREEDAEWFRQNNVKLSMEDCGMDYAVYADCGFTVDDDPNEDPAEIIEMVKGRTCEDVMKALREKCAKRLTTDGSKI